jgi:hypothetical protein
MYMTEIKYTVLFCVCENFVNPFGYGSGTVINYGSGSGSVRSVFKLRFRFRNTGYNLSQDYYF